MRTGRSGRGWVLTRVVNIVEGSGQDLEGASEVQEVELVVQGEEHINWLVVGHCTRLGGHLGQLKQGDGWKRLVTLSVSETGGESIEQQEIIRG